MDNCVYKRSQNIVISPKKSVNSECSLKQHFFDPSKSSPPNEFMLKLKARYERFNKVTNCINE